MVWEAKAQVNKVNSNIFKVALSKVFLCEISSFDAKITQPLQKEKSENMKLICFIYRRPALNSFIINLNI